MTDPYYSDDHARGTIQSMTINNGRFTSEAQKGIPKSDAHKKALSEAAKKVWQTKRKPKPVGSTHMHNGYVMEKTENGEWTKQHHLRAEEHLERPLRQGEHVHHINADPTDNRIENLWVTDRSGHSAAHHSMNAILAGLIADGLITFDRSAGVYRRAA